ncbi:MAG: hypothetical protein CL610_09350 [Anaerolineaceae bacterium]|nr:hypothetical protein [Anaerolineaceae bacterium]
MKIILVSVALWTIAALAISLHPQAGERNNTGNALYMNGDNTTALEAYYNAQVRAPDAPQAYYNAASALAGAGRLRDAADALEQALNTANPDMLLEIYFNLGNVYFEMARYDDAVTTYRQALQLDPNDQDVRYNYELALLRRIPTPTPTPQEQKTNPEEDDSDEAPTPTPNPSGQDASTPTPPPISPPDETATPEGGISGDREDNLPSTPTPSAGGPLSVEDVERQLDAIKENQQTLREFLNHAATPSRPNIRDW